MSDEILEEECADCDSQLVRVDEDDLTNPHNCPIVTCPGCLTIVRRER